MKIVSKIIRYEEELARLNKYSNNIFKTPISKDMEQIKNRIKPEIFAVGEPILKYYYQLYEQHKAIWKNIIRLGENNNFNEPEQTLDLSTIRVPEIQMQPLQLEAPISETNNSIETISKYSQSEINT